MTFRYAHIGLATGLLLTGCAGANQPQNAAGPLFMEEKLTSTRDASSDPALERACPDAGTAQFIVAPRVDARPVSRRPSPSMRYSRGDRINIKVMDGEDFSGDFVINIDGLLHLPFTRPIKAEGLSNDELMARISSELRNGGMFKDNTLRLSVRPIQYAPIYVNVSGAVYRPGRVLINQIRDADKAAPAFAKFGDSPLERFVAAGIRSAGGVRPDADVSAVYLKRNGVRYRLDWRGVFTGQKVDDMPLIAGDELEVAESPCFQSGLMRPSQITPEGIRIFVSNLTQPATANAAAAVSQFAQSMPYGTRLLQGLVSGNCVGGAVASNADRSAVLISTNPKTGKTEVIERSVEQLVRSADRDQINPYLMPDDAIACYDGALTNIREVISTATAGLASAAIVKGLGR